MGDEGEGGFGPFVVKEGGEFDFVGWAEFDEDEAAFELFGNGADGGGDDNELLAIEAGGFRVAEAAADFGGVAEGLVEILEMEDGRVGMGDDEVEGTAGGFSAGDGRLVVEMEAFGEAPGPDGEGEFGEEAADAEFLRGTDIGEGAAGLEDLAQGAGGAALGSGVGHE